MVPLLLANVGQFPATESQVIGSLPLKFTSPKSSRPRALPPAMPGYQAMTTAGTLANQGMSITLPPSSTTTIGLPSAATAVMRPFWTPVAWDQLVARASAKVFSITGTGVLLAFVERREARDDDDEVRVGAPRRRCCRA